LSKILATDPEVHVRFPELPYFFGEVVGLERGPFSLEGIIEEMLDRKSSDFGLENREYGNSGSSALTT
jgi:hypothetical protein